MKPSRPTKRTQLVLWGVLFTAGGAIINVAVAWWIHLHVDVLAATPQLRAPTPSEQSWWQHNVPPGFASRPDGLARWRVPSREAVLLSENPYAVGSGKMGDFADIGRCGWPFLSMENIIWNERPSGAQIMWGVCDVPDIWCYWPLSGSWVPLRPVWMGFILNTCIYGMLVGLTLTGAMQLRRKQRMHRRIKRGRCPACAYKVGSSPVCTECGVPVRSTPRAAEH